MKCPICGEEMLAGGLSHERYGYFIGIKQNE